MMIFSDEATPHILEDFKSSVMERKYYNLGMESFKEFISKLKNLKKENIKIYLGFKK